MPDLDREYVDNLERLVNAKTEQLRSAVKLNATLFACIAESRTALDRSDIAKAKALLDIALTEIRKAGGITTPSVASA